MRNLFRVWDKIDEQSEREGFAIKFGKIKIVKPNKIVKNTTLSKKLNIQNKKYGN
jgi:hypothetical protein